MLVIGYELAHPIKISIGQLCSCQTASSLLPPKVLQHIAEPAEVLQDLIVALFRIVTNEHGVFLIFAEMGQSIADDLLHILNLRHIVRLIDQHAILKVGQADLVVSGLFSEIIRGDDIGQFGIAIVFRLPFCRGVGVVDIPLLLKQLSIVRNAGFLTVQLCSCFRFRAIRSSRFELFSSLFALIKLLDRGNLLLGLLLIPLPDDLPGRGGPDSHTQHKGNQTTHLAHLEFPPQSLLMVITVRLSLRTARKRLTGYRQ